MDLKTYDHMEVACKQEIRKMEDRLHDEHVTKNRIICEYGDGYTKDIDQSIQTLHEKLEALHVKMNYCKLIDDFVTSLMNRCDLTENHYYPSFSTNNVEYHMPLKTKTGHDISIKFEYHDPVLSGQTAGKGPFFYSLKCDGYYMKEGTSNLAYLAEYHSSKLPEGDFGDLTAIRKAQPDVDPMTIVEMMQIQNAITEFIDSTDLFVS